MFSSTTLPGINTVGSTLGLTPCLKIAKNYTNTTVACDKINMQYPFIRVCGLRRKYQNQTFPWKHAPRPPTRHVIVRYNPPLFAKKKKKLHPK